MKSTLNAIMICLMLLAGRGSAISQGTKLKIITTLNYLRNVAVLQDLLDRDEALLAPQTVAQLKSSLRTIDEAILEARNALARDPANKMLIEMLSGTYRQKVDLLRRTTEMVRGS